MNELELPRLVAQLPEAARELLAQGPMLPGEMGEDCRVCLALRPLPVTTENALTIYRWHQAPWPNGDEQYRRCLAIYRAAGWAGEYDARDLHGFQGDDG